MIRLRLLSKTWVLVFVCAVCRVVVSYWLLFSFSFGCCVSLCGPFSLIGCSFLLLSFIGFLAFFLYWCVIIVFVILFCFLFFVLICCCIELCCMVQFTAF